ncbi:flippase-like domain-containing protein [Patescibacteria group bacterium]|nr:flippase-like domain-containing protein [Patescibacteria group bacterium]MBU1703705.1 flippase-like domain-containing protein [Patescibacteria group bacterium]MBU1954262.1 flippase-like domain-containing protein [Patescibacteria group bacterium]
MKKRLVVLSLFTVLGIILFAGVVLQTGFDEIWRHLRQFSLLHFGIFIFLSFLNFGLYTLRWHLILRTISGAGISFWRLFLHRMSGFALSYLTPSAQTGGEPLRILLLSNDGVPSNTATSSAVIDKALEFAALFLFIGIGILVAILDGSLPPEMRTVGWVLLVIMFAAIFWFYFASMKNIGFFSSILRFFRFNRFRKVQSLHDRIIELENEMASFYKHHLRTFFGLVLISLVTTSFLLLEHYLVARFMGVRLTFLQTFLVSTIPYIAYIVPVPGGLGLLEGGTAAVFVALGVAINAFVLVFIIRIRDLIFVFLGLIHASKQGFQMLKTAFQDKNKS